MNTALLSAPTRVLFLTSRENRAQLIKQALLDSSTRFEVSFAEELPAASDLLQKFSFDVALVEFGRNCSGVEAIDWLSEQQVQLPVVVLVPPDHLSDAFTVFDDAAMEFMVIDQTSPQAVEWSIRNSIKRKQQKADLAVLQRNVVQTRAKVRRLTRRLQRQYTIAENVADRAAHDMRSSLAVIWEYTSILRDGLCGNITPDQAGMLEIVHDRADDAGQIVDALIDFSKIYTGRLRIVRRICDIAEITGPAARQLAKKARLQGLEFVAEIDPGLPPVFCDPEIVSRILSNLGTRVIKSCGALCTIRLWAYEEPDSQQVVFGINQFKLPACDDSQTDDLEPTEDSCSEVRPGTEKFCLIATVTRELIDRNLGQLTEEPGLCRDSGPSFGIPVALPEEILERYLIQLRCRPQCPAAVAVVRAWIEPDGAPAANLVDRILNYVLRRDDLAIRLEDGEWLLVVPATPGRTAEVATRLQSIQKAIKRHQQRRELPQLHTEIEAISSIQVTATDLLTSYSGNILNQGFRELCQPIQQS